MNFISPLFLPVFVLFLLLYRRFSLTWQNRLLLAGSIVFLALLDWRLLGLVCLSVVVDFHSARAMAAATQPGRRRALLGLSLAVDLGVLVYFKYAGFFVSGLLRLLSLLGFHPAPPLWRIVLPAALSFYSFRTLGYVLDVYRGRSAPCRRITDYALFVTFFPQFSSGPIERADRFLPQLNDRPRRPGRDALVQGSWLLLWGFFKKRVVADNLAVIVQSAFAPGALPSGFDVLLAVYAFTIQIYCDFSGYTDIARGIGKLLGFETMRNFDRPYRSTSPVEFWQRWHISLSSWLRDYLFLPLAYFLMRRLDRPLLGLQPEHVAYIGGMFITMVLCGLWHGAAATFVLWGAYHGLLTTGHHLATRLKKRRRRRKSPLRRALHTILMFHAAALGWLIFRSADTAQVVHLLRLVLFRFSPPLVEVGHLFLLLFLTLCLLGFEHWVGDKDDPRGSAGWSYGLGPLAVSLIVLLLIVFTSPTGENFIYTQF